MSVEDYRSSTDGSDTACALAAISATAGGGKILWPKTSYEVTQTLLLNTRVEWQGNGLGTTIKLANGANCDLVSTSSFATLTGGGTQGGPEKFRLSNIRLNGNGANQTATSWTFRVYGFNYTIDNVEITAGRDGNVWSDPYPRVVGAGGR